MNKRSKAALVGFAAILGILVLSASSCSTATPKRADQLQESQKNFDARTPPEVSGDVEYNNYIQAQELYDDPSSVIWCTMFPNSPTAPVVTVPIRGKLTSSSVSYYPNLSPEQWSWGSEGGYMQENQSVDGMFHGSPPPYRYGFTPTGQYVDFFDIPTFCTTALTEFGQQTLSIVLK